eukprot:725884-Hanusia_phi.AAC.1
MDDPENFVMSRFQLIDPLKPGQVLTQREEGQVEASVNCLDNSCTVRKPYQKSFGKHFKGVCRS